LVAALKGGHACEGITGQGIDEVASLIHKVYTEGVAYGVGIGNHQGEEIDKDWKRTEE